MDDDDDDDGDNEIAWLSKRLGVGVGLVIFLLAALIVGQLLFGIWRVYHPSGWSW